MDTLTEDQWEELDALIYTGYIIKAIKYYRETTGSSFMESHRVIDERHQELLKSMPEKFKKEF